MADSQSQILADAIDLLIANTGLIFRSRREILALGLILKDLDPHFEKKYRTHLAEASESGEELYEAALEMSQKLALAKVHLGSTGS